MPRTFTLLRTLGRGAHGSVHLAEMRDEEDYVQSLAVKRLLPECSQDPDLAARLKDEARLLALLQHDHVVRVHGLTRIDGGLAVLMEPVVGADLGRLGALPPRVALGVVEAVADALDAAYNTVPPGQDQPLAVVHRDIKPSNVMVTPRGGVKVMDFGVARATFGTREGETHSQQFGTARYMAPERWLYGQAEHRSDVFSLGITLIEIATGRPVPRARLSADGFARDIAQAVAPLPPTLRDLATRMTAFAREDRPSAAEVAATCRALISAMEGPLLREWATSHVVPTAGEPLDPTATATVVREETATPSLPWSPPSRARWLPYALPPLAVLAIAAWLWPDPAPERAAPFPPAPVPVAVVPPARDPVPVPVPVPAPEAEPATALSLRRPVPTPAPAPAEPAEPAPLPTQRVRFSFDAPGLSAETDWGRIRGPSPGLLTLPADRPVEVRITSGDRRWSCTISTSSGDVRIFSDGRCTQ